jgi:glycine hydroxymethyltransferase
VESQRANWQAQTLDVVDSELSEFIEQETFRQQSHLNLIASENFCSKAVLEAQGSVLTNKYAEGYPSRRYSGGCEFVDGVESLAIARCKKLFKAEYVNVQLHSGSQANMAVYYSFCQPGDRILAMDLSHGGHLTHGSPVSFSGREFNFAHYGVRRDTGTIDYDQVRDLAHKFKPVLIVAGASAYPRTLDFEVFSQIARECKARFMVDMAHISGLVAGGCHPSPVGVADYVTSTTHKTLRGPRGGFILVKAEYGRKIDSNVFPGIQGGPLMHTIAAKAVAFQEAQSGEFQTYASRLVANAAVLAKGLIEEGLEVVSGGTDNHLVLVDTTNLDLTGKQSEAVLSEVGITVNKNAIPFDEQPPGTTSGIRIGTPALTSRGFEIREIESVARMIGTVLKNPDSGKIKTKVKAQVDELCHQFPVWGPF